MFYILIIFLKYIQDANSDEPDQMPAFSSGSALFADVT